MWICRVLSDDIKSVPVVVDDIRGSISKWITDGSRVALMDVIGFLCASLGSSTVQLHDSSRCACACLEANFSSQNGDRSRICYCRAAFCCVFFWAKGLCAKDIHAEMFPVYGGKCLSRKVVHKWVQKFSQGCSAVASIIRGSDWDTSQMSSMLLVLTHWESCGTSVSLLLEDTYAEK
jgi:hypothetical protein